MEYRLTVGLEIHAELKTRTKMFCACLSDPDEKEANKNICPVCMAHPGTLPVINREAVHKVLLVGSAVGGNLADFTEFDRKNYFYPDIPKGYQISQYKYPLVSGGSLAGVELTRIHLEEDTARSQHSGEKSLVDYNRAGVPLMELVTEPVIRDAETAGRFAKELQLLLRYLGAGEANMEKGEMRVEVNISVAPVRSATEINQKESPVLGTKVEVKNLNSFRSVERAIAFEFKRQSKLLDKGGKVVQETRGWDEAKQETFSQRKKESSHDYRYFPDPDLPKLKISEIPEFLPEQLKSALPELPWAKRERYMSYGLKEDEANFLVEEDGFLQIMFEVVTRRTEDRELTRLAANYIISDVRGYLNKAVVNWDKNASSNMGPEAFLELMTMVKEGEVSSRAAKDIIPEMFVSSKSPKAIAKEKGILQQSDAGALAEIAKKVVEANPAVVADYRAGKDAAMQFLVGQGMKVSRGSANPAALREAIGKAIV
ncbi:MAG TPA: Asp-tRNA(Asn)/Glu-tRNA(Gln) amidotransferase subunit GatB [Candidatus Paceibacterota bacterium]|nr:Asp-tRNA(Asn)/Glu-tRNA(Gln) amidotransferase subunit GatB [Candidatus Paceibacterota bacterium]